jgi:uncharacterized protein (DUF1501 family)
MKRRNFLKIFSAAGVTPFVVNGHALRPFANSKMAKILGSCDGIEERILVLIQLKGGNDGLNMIVPTPQYDAYANLRPTIKLDQNSLINLDGTLPSDDQIGLHPALQSLKVMYDEGRACVVQGVGYQSMNQSHFKGTDLWLTGGDGTPANYTLGSGWMGRALQAIYPDVLGAPTADMLDPLGIQVGDSNPSLGFHTETEHQNALNLSGQDPAGFYSLVQTIGGEPVLNVPDSEQGEQIEYIMGVEQSVSLYAQRITSVFNAGTNSISTYPTSAIGGASLASQLKTIARLISGGCKTKIYLCQLGGFDTHNAQVDGAGSTTTGTHADLLQYMADSVKTFLDDLQGMGLADQVVACTFSEFGRCAKENGSDGTDHGTLSSMMLFGKNIQAGVLGTNVNLGNLTNDNQLQGVQHDYRQVFATLLQDWLGANNEVMEQTMFDGYAKLNVVDSAFVVNPDCYLNNGSVATGEALRAARSLRAYPNPARINVEVSYTATRAFDGRITLHSLGGSVISGSSVRVNEGDNLFFLDVSDLPTGPYFIRLENKLNGAGEVVKISVVR